MRRRYAEELLAIRRSVDEMLGRTTSIPPAPVQEAAVPAEAPIFDSPTPSPPPAEELPLEEPSPAPSPVIEPAPKDANEEIQVPDTDIPPEDEETLAPEGAIPAPLTDEATLQVQVTAAHQAIPIPEALVLISRQDPGEPLETLIRVMGTDVSGLTPDITVPAPDRELTQAPGEYLPYVTYRVVVVAEGYRPQFHGNVAVFGGMSTLLPVALVPILEDSVPPPSRAGENFTSL